MPDQRHAATGCPRGRRSVGGQERRGRGAVAMFRGGEAGEGGGMNPSTGASVTQGGGFALPGQ